MKLESTSFEYGAASEVGLLGVVLVGRFISMYCADDWAFLPAHRICGKQEHGTAELEYSTLYTLTVFVIVHCKLI